MKVVNVSINNIKRLDLSYFHNLKILLMFPGQVKRLYEYLILEIESDLIFLREGLTKVHDTLLYIHVCDQHRNYVDNTRDHIKRALEITK